MSKPFTNEPLGDLIASLCCLPGVGEKTARRMAYHLLQKDREGAERIAVSLHTALNDLRHCERCNSFTVDTICETCHNPQRDPSLLCIVENPIDKNMIETSHSFNGLYYVLMGKLDPINNIGAKELQFEKLLNRVDDGLVKEIILATNYTTEGETTAYYLEKLFKLKDIKVSRLARGVPAGSELEYVDAGTIAWALHERR